jgi:hypothetical protein
MTLASRKLGGMVANRAGAKSDGCCLMSLV